MIKLDTIQKEKNLNNVYAIGEKGPGSAYHNYSIISDLGNGYIRNQFIEFQLGGRNTIGSVAGSLKMTKANIRIGSRNTINSVPGATNEDLLEIVRHRLQCFQESDFKCDYNLQALIHIEAALYQLNKRTKDRYRRGVLGTYEK